MSTNAAEAVDHKKAYFEKLFAKVDEVGAKGYTLVVGVQADCSKDADDDDNDSKEDEKSDRRVYTKEQMETLRVILISERRDSYLKKAAKMVTGGQSGYCMMFNTHTGNQTIMGILRMTKTAKSKKALSEKFDALFGLTYQIHAYDFWVSDNELSGPEGELEESMQNLGKAWSGLLAHTDAELGIDSEYTRPGIEALLRRFTESVNSTLEQVDCAPFEWDSYKTAPAVSGAKGKKRKAAGEAPV